MSSTKKKSLISSALIINNHASVIDTVSNISTKYGESIELWNGVTVDYIIIIIIIIIIMSVMEVKKAWNNLTTN